jgi:hypothetical protein
VRRDLSAIQSGVRRELTIAVLAFLSPEKDQDLYVAFISWLNSLST